MHHQRCPNHSAARTGTLEEREQAAVATPARAVAAAKEQTRDEVDILPTHEERHQERTQSEGKVPCVDTSAELQPQLTVATETGASVHLLRRGELERKLAEAGAANVQLQRQCAELKAALEAEHSWVKRVLAGSTQQETLSTGCCKVSYLKVPAGVRHSVLQFH